MPSHWGNDRWEALRAMRRMLPLSIFAAISFGAALSTAADAKERIVRCKLVVAGKTIFSGACDYEALGSDGSFTISERKKRHFYFAYLVRDDADAEGSWNADRMSTHAGADLGPMTQAGGCWQTADKRNRICAWK
jgi:hypothetical protein